MDNMILSPMQQDDVTRGEFEGLKTSMNTRFDEQEEYTKDGFGKVFKQIDTVEENMGRRFDIVEEKVDSAIDQIKLLTTTVNFVANQVKSLVTKVDTTTDQVKLLTKIVTDSSK